MTDGVPWTHTVKCACGAEDAVETSSFGRERTCASCGAAYKVIWALDPKTRERVPRRMSSKGDTLRMPKGAHPIVCDCGQPLAMRKEHAGKKVKCPVCGVAMTLEVTKDPQTLETRIRRKPDGETKIVAATSLGRTTRRRKAPPGGQDILCQCGEYLRVLAEHLEKRAMCPECGTVMRLERHRDPETKITQVRAKVIGRESPPPKPEGPETKPDSGKWSLKDFE